MLRSVKNILDSKRKILEEGVDFPKAMKLVGKSTGAVSVYVKSVSSKAQYEREETTNTALF